MEIVKIYLDLDEVEKLLSSCEIENSFEEITFKGEAISIKTIKDYKFDVDITYITKRSKDSSQQDDYGVTTSRLDEVISYTIEIVAIYKDDYTVDVDTDNLDDIICQFANE